MFSLNPALDFDVIQEKQAYGVWLRRNHRGAIDRIADSSSRGSFNDRVGTEEFSPMVRAMWTKRSLENGA
jgi:hypothetical protein